MAVGEVDKMRAEMREFDYDNYRGYTTDVIMNLEI